MPTKIQNHQRKTQPARGQSMVEFALALPALLILLLGLIELALVLRAQLVLTNANREAARYASHGAFTDEQVAERAKIAFAKQLPIELSGPEANTSIIITRFHVPAGEKEATYEDPPYFTGTLVSESKLGVTPEKLAEFANGLKEQNASFITSNDVVIVETFYYHNQVLNAPIVSWVFPEPITLYMRTSMRMSRPRIQTETQE